MKPTQQKQAEKKAGPTPSRVALSFCDAEPEDYGQTAKVKMCRYDSKGRAVYSWERIPAATLAAAPDLLEACREAFKFLPTGNALEAVTAAIRKAEQGGR